MDGDEETTAKQMEEQIFFYIRKLVYCSLSSVKVKLKFDFAFLRADIVNDK